MAILIYGDDESSEQMYNQKIAKHKAVFRQQCFIKHLLMLTQYSVGENRRQRGLSGW